MTVPGTGHLHNISVTIDGERSLVPEGVTLSYGPPSILTYSDEGSYRAFTRGSQVRVSFGGRCPAARMIVNELILGFSNTIRNSEGTRHNNRKS
jgi:hypothetical protein